MVHDLHEWLIFMVNLGKYINIPVPWIPLVLSTLTETEKLRKNLKNYIPSWWRVASVNAHGLRSSIAWPWKSQDQKKKQPISKGSLKAVQWLIFLSWSQKSKRPKTLTPCCTTGYNQIDIIIEDISFLNPDWANWNGMLMWLLKITWIIWLS